jgi:hypothetical protein
MPSKQSETVKELYRGWTRARLEPDQEVDNEHWGDLTAEPRGVDYIETDAGGLPAAAAYLRDEDGVHRPFGVAVLTTTPTGIARIVVFGGPGHVARFCPPKAP